MNRIQAVTPTFLQSINLRTAGAVALAFALFTSARQVNATDLTWTNDNGTFSTPENWEPPQAPADGDATFFTNNTSYTVDFTANTPIIQNSTFSGQTAVVTLNMGAFTWTVTNQVRVGRGLDAGSTVYLAGGTLTIGTGLTGGQLRIGDGTTGDVSAAGIMFVTNGTVKVPTIVVGASSNAVGKLVISGSGVVTNRGSGSGTLVVGSGSFQPNQLIVTNGSKLFVIGQVRIGAAGTSNNLGLFSGPTSVVVAEGGSGSFKVGAGSRGNTLIVSNGAKLFVLNGGTIGSDNLGASFNTGIVVGAGSAIIQNPAGTTLQLRIGTNGGGSTNNNMTVYDGGFINFESGTITVGNDISSISNSLNMGGLGAMSTGIASQVRNESNSQYNQFIVTNAYFTSSLYNLQGNTNSASVLANGTWVFSNSFAVAADQTNALNVIGKPGASFVVNGGTVSVLSGSNAFSMVTGNGSINCGNVFVITNGGKLLTELGTIGSASMNNTGIVVGVGSVWSNFGPRILVGAGEGGSNNHLAVVNGGSFYNAGTLNIGNNPTAMVNSVSIGGVGVSSTFVNVGSLNVGGSTGTYSNRLSITNAIVNIGTLSVGNDERTNNLLEIRGGTTTVSFIRVHGTNTIVFTAGTLKTGGSTVNNTANNGGPTVVGDGTSAAVLELASGGAGIHDFNLGGLVITNNATLRGNGTLSGTITVLGTLQPGLSLGTIATTSHLVLGPSTVLAYELGISGGETGDLTQVGGSLTLDGTLNIADSGGFDVGVYTLFTYAGALTDNGLTIGSNPNGSLTYTIDKATTNVIRLNVTSGGGDPFTTWQNYYGLSGGNAGGTNDFDGDGMNNTNEFLAGFVPTNSAAYLHIISIARTATTNVTVTYLGASGDSNGSPGPKTNVLEFTTGTGNGSYTSTNFVSTGQTNVLSGGSGLGAVSSFVDTNGAAGATRYYRVRVLVP